MIEGKSILIVGANQAFIDVVKIRLEDNGYRARAVLDLHLTNNLVKNMHPDLLLYDLSDENINILHRLEYHQSFPEIQQMKTIYFGTKQDVNFRWKALSNGLAGYIEKPYKPEELLYQIENALMVK